jgi:biopolymer transport protein ExbB/TolQ
MNFAIAGIVGWLLILAAAMALANAAQRGDELAEAARRNRPDSARSAEIIPFDRAAFRGASARAARPLNHEITSPHGL